MSNCHKVKHKKLINNIKEAGASAFCELLNGPILSSAFEHLSSGLRNRIYTPLVSLSMFLSQVLRKNSSCQQVVDEFVIKRMSQGHPNISTATGAYCQARKALPLEMIASLTQSVGALIKNQIPSQWKFRGRSTRLVDGTTMLMPDTEENQIAYPQQANQKEGLGFPICRMVAITDLETGAVVDAAISPYSGKQTGETTLFRNMMNSLNKGDILLGDALFSTYFIMCELGKRGIDFLFEQMGGRRQNVNFDLGRKLGAKDHIIKLEKPKNKPDWMSKEAYDSAPDNLLIREFKADGKVLVSSMLCFKEMPKKLLSKHYKKRWSVEVDIRNIKTTMGMEMLSCKTPDMVVKEVCVYLLAYNIIRLLMMRSALLNKLLPREISFKHCAQLWLAWCQQEALIEIENNTQIFILMAQRRVANRPGRVEPRAIKRRPKAYVLLMRPRDECKIDIRQHGHPKRKK